MLTVVAVVVGLLGALVMIVGVVWAILWTVARHAFDRLLKSRYVDETKAQVSDLLEGIRNPLVRRVLSKHTGEVAGAMLVSIIEGELKSRARLGLMILAAGVGLVIAAFYVPSWWPGLMSLFSR